MARKPHHITYRSRRGSTLVELCIVMALLAIVSTMIVTFSAIIGKYVKQNQRQYAFIEESSRIKQAMSHWLFALDEAGNIVTVTDQQISLQQTESRVVFDAISRSLFLVHPDGTVKDIGTKTVDGISYSLEQLSATTSILKCIVTGSDARSNMMTQDFLLTLRCGSFAEEGGAYE